jgi:hypothetical protein
MEIRIVIENGIWHGARAKSYRATPEEIEQIEREKSIQRERDELARKLAFGTPDDAERQPPPESKP